MYGAKVRKDGKTMNQITYKREIKEEWRGRGSGRKENDECRIVTGDKLMWKVYGPLQLTL